MIGREEAVKEEEVAPLSEMNERTKGEFTVFFLSE
jgi:hypothetical protein